MSTQPFDYAAIVADLEAKKAAIEATLGSLRSAMAIGALGQSGDVPAPVNGAASSAAMYGGDVPDGAFHGKSIPESAKLYLEIVNKKQSTREIADALVKGGMESTSGNFVGIVHAVLNRARKSPISSIVKLGSHWGLKAWYPKGVISAAAPTQKKGKKKQRKTAKTSEPKATAAVKHPEPTKPGSALTASGAKDKIVEMLTLNPHLEYTAQELAAEVGQPLSMTHLILANLVRAHKVEKTAHKKYRLASRPAEVLHAVAS